MVASVPSVTNVATAGLRGPPPLPAKLAQNGNVEVNVVEGQGPLHVGAACGVTPKVGFSSAVKAVGRPESSLTCIIPDGTTPKYAGSLLCVTRRGTCTCKIRCELAEFGEVRVPGDDVHVRVHDGDERLAEVVLADAAGGAQ